jgi:hypothetical protein
MFKNIINEKRIQNLFEPNRWQCNILVSRNQVHVYNQVNRPSCLTGFQYAKHQHVDGCPALAGIACSHETTGAI